MCSSQFPITVYIYLPWSSVYTLSRGPLWPSIISCFSFLECEVVIPMPSPGLENCHLSCVHYWLFIVTPVHMFISRGRLCNIDQRTPRTVEARDAFSMAYWNTVHIYTYECVCVFCLFVWFKDASKSYLHEIENKQFFCNFASVRVPSFIVEHKTESAKFYVVRY
jgi:hypothetical protein